MAQIYNDTKKADLMSFGKSFARLNGQPLDESAIWSTYEKATAYAKTAGAYVGQIIAVLGENKVTFYGIQDAAGTLKEVGSKPVGDNKGIIIKTDGTVTIKGLEGATVGYIAKKAADGSIEWVKEAGYDDTTIKADISAIKAQNKTFGTDISGLKEKDNAQDLVIQGQNTRLTAVEAAYVKNVDYVAKTGVFTFTLQDGTTKDIDLAIEKVVTNFKYDSTKQSLVLTLADGTTQEVPMGAFINDYTGSTGTDIKVDVSKDNEISASLINGSIVAGKIAANAITTDKILDNNVTAAKLADSINTDIAKGVDAQTRVSAAEGKITANESAIGQLQTDIGTKASDSEFQTVKNAVNSTTTGLATKASQSSVDTLVQTVNSHGKTIATKADSSTVETLAERVSVNETAITEIKEKDNSQDSLIAGLRTDVDTKQTAAQVNNLIQAANINVNKLTQTTGEVFIINGGKAADK